jgi:hypothetical protein
MDTTVSSSLKLALVGGALGGPMSVVAVLLFALANVFLGTSVSFALLDLMVIAAVGLFVGVLIAIVAGFPMFVLLTRLGLGRPIFIALWSALLGGVAYHVLFMLGSPIDWQWVLTGSFAGLLAGGTPALLIAEHAKRGGNAL